MRVGFANLSESRCNGNMMTGRFNASFVAAVSITTFVGIHSSSAIAGGDAAAGKKRAAACVTCHGIDGLSKLPGAPNLAGQAPQYLEKQLRAFRAGERKDENMNVVTKGLSDDDIANLAAWYSSIEITVKLPGR